MRRSSVALAEVRCRLHPEALSNAVALRLGTAIVVGLALISVAGVGTTYGVEPGHRATSTGATQALEPGARRAPNDGCTPVPVESVRYLNSQGATVPAPASASSRRAAGRRLFYRLPGGAIMETTVPPAGFDPFKASPRLDRAFGLPVPTDVARLAAWRVRHVGTTVVPSMPCIGQGSMRYATTGSTNWGGWVATAHTYTRVYDDQSIPKYATTAACGGIAGSAVAHWIGLGGHSSARLIQQGFATSSTSTNGVRLWFEYLNAAHSNPPIYVANTGRTGDVISENLVYSASNGGTATFNWYDRTARIQYTPSTLRNVAGYYSGMSGDFVSEVPEGYALRQFSSETFSAMGARYGATYANLSNLPRDHVLLTTDGRTTAAQLLTVNAVSPSNVFNEHWVRCF